MGQIYKSYPEYKDSGIDWLGDIPAHWEVKRLKRFDGVTNPKKSQVALAPEAEVSFIPMESVGEFGGLNLEQVRPLDEVYDGYTYLANGDICIAKITPCFENGKGALASGLKNGVGFGTTELHIVRTEEELSPRFFFYVSISHAFRSLGTAEMMGAGGQKRVPEDFIKDWQLTRPSLPQQERIADFLDERTARIDGLIARKERLLELLAEKRQALITRAVTKGINLDAGRRDRHAAKGVGLVNNIVRIVRDRLPDGWTDDWLKWSVDLVSVRATEDEAAELPYLSNEDIASWTGELLTEQKPKEAVDARRFKTGDVLFNKLRPYLAKAHLAKFDGVSSGELLCLRPSSRVSSRYLFYYVLSHRLIEKVNAATFGSKMPRADWNIVGHQTFSMPARAEQERIADFLDEQTARIDEVIVKNECFLELLAEQRQALITAAVTGQIDVRQLATESVSV